MSRMIDDAGKIRNVVGLDLTPDYPKNPDFHYEWNGEIKVEILSKEIFETLIQQKRV